MLVLTRRIGHRLIIRDTEGEIEDIIVEVVRSRGRSELQLGITAPQRIKVLRQEVADRPPRPQTPPSAEQPTATSSPTPAPPPTPPSDPSRPQSMN